MVTNSPTHIKLKKLQRPVRLDQSVQQSIKDYILQNKMHPGDALPSELEFARQLGVSRIPVREAVKALETLGIVDVQHGSGLFVGDFSIEPLLNNLPYNLLFNLHTLTDILEVRRVLEAGMLEAGMQAMKPETLMTLQETLDEMREMARRGEELGEKDRLFHNLLFQDLGNPILLRILDAFWLTLHHAMARVDLHDRNPQATYLDHAAILEALLQGNLEMARKALYDHHHGILGRIRDRKEEVTKEVKLDA